MRLTMGGTRRIEMSITAVLTTRAKSGKYQRVREGMGEMKGVMEGLGIQTRLTHAVTGDHQGDLSLATTYDSWKAFGEASEKIEASKEYRALIAKAGEAEDSAIEHMSTVILSDID